jgi:hypothetical protein
MTFGHSANQREIKQYQFQDTAEILRGMHESGATSLSKSLKRLRSRMERLTWGVANHRESSTEKLDSEILLIRRFSNRPSRQKHFRHPGLTGGMLVLPNLTVCRRLSYGSWSRKNALFSRKPSICFSLRSSIARDFPGAISISLHYPFNRSMSPRTGGFWAPDFLR